MFSAAGFPKLVKMILHEGRNGRRYQRVFIHQFDDTWDIELELVVNRFEGIARREPQAAALAVAEGHRRIIELTRARADDPRISSFLGGGAAT